MNDYYALGILCSLFSPILITTLSGEYDCPHLTGSKAETKRHIHVSKVIQQEVFPIYSASLSHIHHTAFRNHWLFFLRVHAKALVLRKSGDTAPLFKDEGESVESVFIQLSHKGRIGFCFLAQRRSDLIKLQVLFRKAFVQAWKGVPRCRALEMRRGILGFWTNQTTGLELYVIKQDWLWELWLLTITALGLNSSLPLPSSMSLN